MPGHFPEREQGKSAVPFFVIQQHVHLSGIIGEVEGVIFQGLSSLLASSLHFLSFTICIYNTHEVNKVESQVCIQGVDLCPIYR